MTSQTEMAPEGSEKIVVIPVEWGQLSKDTFLWYLNTVHLSNHCVHVIYVPDFRRHLQPGMSITGSNHKCLTQFSVAVGLANRSPISIVLLPNITAGPMEVMEIMIETNTESEQLKKLYDGFLEQRKVKGKFVRVGGNNRWCAIVEYCKLVGAVLLVLGTQPKPGRPSQYPMEQANPYRSEQNLKQNSDKGDNASRGFLIPPRSNTTSGASASDSVVSSRASFISSTHFKASLRDLGPFAATVTHDVLDHCTCSVIVYREPLRTILRKQKGTVQP